MPYWTDKLQISVFLIFSVMTQQRNAPPSAVMISRHEDSRVNVQRDPASRASQKLKNWNSKAATIELSRELQSACSEFVLALGAN